MKKMLKYFSAVIACVLIAVFMINQASDIITYAVEDNTYLESVEIFNAPTKEEAKEKCKAAGYYASDADLNAGNSGGAMVIGYTVTGNPDEAITDLSVLEMNSGYEVTDYADIKENAMEKTGFVTSELKYSVADYRDNLEKNSPEAIKAKQILNIYTIPEMDNIGLGDYLAGNKFTEDFLKKIICQTNADIISTRSGMEFNNLTKESSFEKTADEIITLTYVIGSAIDILSAVTVVGANIATIRSIGVAAWWAG